MKFIHNTISICQYQFRILCHNSKLFMILICLSLFLWNTLLPIRNFLSSVHENTSPFLFPFLFNDATLAALIFAVALLFYIDAPFYAPEQLFILLRSGSATWLFGQVFYIFTISFFYIVFLSGISILFLLPYLQNSSHWGRIWTTLALTDAGSVYGLGFNISADIIFSYSAINAFLMTFIISFLICNFYAFFVWCMNSWFGKKASLILALASIFLTTRVRYLPAWLIYLTPASWANLNILMPYNTYSLSFIKAVLILIIGILSFACLAFCKTIQSDIAK